MSKLRGVRERLGLPIEERGPEEIEVAAGVHGLSQIELDAFVDLAVERYQTKRMDPGDTPPPPPPLPGAFFQTACLSHCASLSIQMCTHLLGAWWSMHVYVHV